MRIATLFVLLLAACTTDKAAPPTTASFAGSCETLASRCHSQKTTTAKQCHDLGHEGDDTKCGPRLDACLSECPEVTPDAGIITDASSNDAANTRAQCETYCACMKSSCASVQNYPFTEESVCYEACATFTTEQRTCFEQFCTEANTPDAGTKAHQCDHATGRLGVVECK